MNGRTDWRRTRRSRTSWWRRCCASVANPTKRPRAFSSSPVTRASTPICGKCCDEPDRPSTSSITTRGLKSSVDHGITEEIGRFLRAEGRFRLLVESDPRARPLLRRFVTTRNRHPRVEIRQMYPQPARVTIVDQREVLIFPVPGSGSAGGDEIAVWTNNPDFLRGQSIYFDTFWERAGPPSLRSPNPARAAPRPRRSRGKR